MKTDEHGFWLMRKQRGRSPHRRSAQPLTACSSATTRATYSAPSHVATDHRCGLPGGAVMSPLLMPLSHRRRYRTRPPPSSCSSSCAFRPIAMHASPPPRSSLVAGIYVYRRATLEARSHCRLPCPLEPCAATTTSPPLDLRRVYHLRATSVACHFRGLRLRADRCAALPMPSPLPYIEGGRKEKQSNERWRWEKGQRRENGANIASTATVRSLPSSPEFDASSPVVEIGWGSKEAEGRVLEDRRRKDPPRHCRNLPLAPLPGVECAADGGTGGAMAASSNVVVGSVGTRMK